MTDFLDEKRGEITRRLEELAPAVAEYAQLEAAAAALASIDGAGPVTRSAVKAPARRGRPRKSAVASRAKAAAPAKAATGRGGRARGKVGRPAGSGGRAQQALEVIHGQPGITVSEIAQKISVAPTYMYRVLPGLQKEGKISKRGKGWHPRGA